MPTEPYIEYPRSGTMPDAPQLAIKQNTEKMWRSPLNIYFQVVSNERRVDIDMMDRLTIDDKVILTADRGYESYNLFAHLKKKEWNYAFRLKDIHSNGISLTSLLSQLTNRCLKVQLEEQLQLVFQFCYKILQS